MNPLALALTTIEPLGRATVLHLAVGKARFSIAIEPPLDGTPFGRATLAVPDAEQGAACVKALAAWLDVDVPRKAKGALATPPPAHLGAIALQRHVDENGVTWQRTKLALGGVEELYLHWPDRGTTAWLSEKDSEVRQSLIEALAVALRDGVAASRAVPVERGVDPLRKDTVPLVTSLERSTRRPATVVGCFWREGRFVFPEYDGRRTRVVSLALDGSADVLATIDAPVRYLALAGPHLVATAEYPKDRQGELPLELWIVRAGEATGARWLPHDANFYPGQMVTPETNDDGTLLAVTGRGARGGAGHFDWVKVLDPHGQVVVELDEPEQNLRAERWADGALVLVDDAGRERTWKPGRRSARVAAKSTPRFMVQFDGHEGLEVRDGTTGQVRALGRLREKERTALAKYRERALLIRAIGPQHALISSGGHLLLDCETLASWVLLPYVSAAVEVSPTLEAVAVMPYGGGLFFGRIDPRWKTGARTSHERDAVLASLFASLEAGRYVFDATPTSLVATDWAARHGLTEAEVVRRLDAAGRARVDGMYRAIDAALTAPDFVTRLASLELPGAPGLVFATLHERKRAKWTSKARAALATRLKQLAAEDFVRTLGHDRKVREALGLQPPHTAVRS